jgi:hypothetical protein
MIGVALESANLTTNPRTKELYYCSVSLVVHKVYINHLFPSFSFFPSSILEHTCKTLLEESTMLAKSILAVLSSACAVMACTIPSQPLPNSISAPFQVQVQNATVARVHNKFMNLQQAGGGDRHLFLDPVGTPTKDLNLTAGVLQWQNIRAVIGGEVSFPAQTIKDRKKDCRGLIMCSTTTSTTQPRCS